MGERILKEGYLYKSPDVAKYIHNAKKWQRKWFSLDSTGDLHIYDSEKSGKAGGLLHIWQCAMIFDPKAKNIPHSFCLGLEMKEYSTYLKADSAATYNEWLAVLRRFVKKCELEEVPETSRHSTLFSDNFGPRAGSVSSVQSRSFALSSQSKFRRKEGYMSKTGGNNKGWKERYFILAQAKLSYFKNEKGLAGEALGSIDLFECSSVVKTNGKKGYGFDLKMPSRVFNLSTETEADLVEWMDVISHTLDAIAAIKASPAKLESVDESHKQERTYSNASSSSLDKVLGGSTEEKQEKLGTRASSTSSGAPREDHKEEVEARTALAGSQEDRAVVQLLEAEVEALRGKVSSLEADLRSSSSVNGQLQEQMVQERRGKDQQIKKLEREKEDLASQVEQLGKAKEELETFNDSIQAQLEEQQEKAQALEDEQIVLRQELDESQTNSNIFEEELSDTQAKLLEIEEVARKLEEALRKRGDSEPPPDLSSLRSLNMSYKAKMAEDQLSHSLGSPPTTPTSSLLPPEPEISLEMSRLREEVSRLESERDALKEQLTTATSPPSTTTTSSSESPAAKKEGEESAPAPPPTATTTTTSSGTADAAAAEHLVHEERLKWQVEVSKVRRELEGQLEEERKGRKEEGDTLRRELKRVEEELAKGNSIRTQLEKSQQRVVQLEGEVKTASERVTQLLAEKEKALADLKTIRKTNKSMEKRLSESETARSSSRASMSSLGSSMEQGSSPLPPSLEGGSLRLMEAEKRNHELQSQLSAVEKERDVLRQELRSQASSRSAAVSIPPPTALNFFGKTSATISTSGHDQAVGGRAMAPPTKTMRNGWSTASVDQAPPPKPKKPPKELVDQFSFSANTGSKRQSLSIDEAISDPPPSSRSRTKSMFQTLFARR